MGFRRFAALSLCLGFLTVPGAAFGQAKPSFARYPLRLAHEFVAVYPADLNGNGLEALIVVQADRLQREPRLYAQVFLQSENGFNAAGEAQPLPNGVALAGCGRFGGVPGLALLLPGEVQVWPWRAQRFAESAALRLPVESVFPVTALEPIPNLQWIAGLTGNGESELIVPRFDGLEVIEFKDGKLTSLGRLAVRPRTRFWRGLTNQSIAHDLPVLFYRDVDGDGWQDVIAFNEGELWVFSLHGSGAGPITPLIQQDLQPPEPFDPRKPYDPPMRLVMAGDLNGDKLLDLVISKNAPTDSDFQSKSTTLVFFGRPSPAGVAFPDKADQVFPAEGFTLPIVLDLNADGREDLIQVNVEVTFWNAVRAIVSRSVKAEAGFYLMAEDGRYPRQANEVESYSVNFSLSRFGHQPIATWGDVNGDGLPDLLLSSGKRELGIHLGRPGKFWNSSADIKITDDLPINQSRLIVRDLNGDKRHDMILTYTRDDNRQMPDTVGLLTVLMSRVEGKPK